jgi:HTH-type transcriptional regulator / antitoxin HigA
VLIADQSYRNRDVYHELVQSFPLRPIRTDEELEAACRQLDKLLDCEELDSGAEDYLFVLERLISDYEDEHHEIPPLPDHELLRQLMDAKGVNQQQVAIATGIVYSTVSDVLRKKRTLTREHIGRLCSYFNVSPDIFSF